MGFKAARGWNEQLPISLQGLEGGQRGRKSHRPCITWPCPVENPGPNHSNSGGFQEDYLES